MNHLFASFFPKFVIVFVYDILVYNSSMDEHLFHLEQVLSQLNSNHFFVKLSKCLFCQATIDYLGHIVSTSGVQADSQKIEAMVHWPPPQNTKQLHGFLGLIGYYRQFIKGYASLAIPLTDLLCKDAFLLLFKIWNPTSVRCGISSLLPSYKRRIPIYSQNTLLPST